MRVVVAVACLAFALTATGGAAAELSPADVAALVAASKLAADDGVAAPDLGAAADRARSPDVAVRAAGVADLSAGAARLAMLSRGRLSRPTAVDHEWALKASYDAQADLVAAATSGRVATWAAALRPRGPAYLALVDLRHRYASIVAAGGWPTIGAGPVVKAGESDIRVTTLRARLAAEGYRPARAQAAPPPEPGRLDATLAGVLREFQVAYGVPQTGVLDKASQEALDVSAADRLAAIELNLERERWMPPDPPAARIEVDIAAQTLTLYQAGEAVLTMRVVVGKPDLRTPMFASALDGIVFNPPWVVPASIAARELYPRERREPGYLARHGFRVIGGQLVQAAGVKSSLGSLKFEMPSPFGVYLHDTPARSLFARPKRAFSHGCIRLEQPRALAAALLAAQGWTPAEIDAAIAAKVTRRLALTTRMPVFVVYRTAVADAEGRLQTRPDLYRWDARLAGALASR